MPKTKVEVYDKDQLIYPYIESDHVTFSNGMKVSEMLDQSISMPTVTHEDLSFKVGVGDQDVSSAIVDSSVSEMTIKGKTYQNILPEPSTHVLTNNKEMFKVNEGLDPNIEIVDGVSKSAILKGRTLVNYVPNYTFTRSRNANSNDYKPVIDFNFTLTKGKKYFVRANITKNTFTDGHAELYFDSQTTNQHGIIVYSQKTGIFSSVVTVNIDGVYRLSNMITNHTTDGEVEITDFVILEYQEGMENWDIPYFEGMQSVKMPVLTTTGKNLWNGEYENGYISPTDGYIPQTKDVRTTKWIKCKPNTTYICNSTSRNRWVLKGVNGVETVVGGVVGNETPTVTTLSDTTHLRCYYKLDGHTVENIQIEEGTSSTTYEPYKTNILHTTNLLSNTTLTQGCINADGSLTTSGESASYSVFTEIIPVKPNTEYYIATDNANITYDRIAYYNSSKTFMRRSDTLYASKSTSLTIPNDTYYIRIAFYQGSGIQITPQQLGNAVCQEMVVLRSLPNGVKDTLNLNTGEYVQRIGEVVLDGSEAWNKDTTTGGTKDNTSIFHTEANFNGFKPSPNVEYRDTMMLCDKIPVKGRIYNLDEEGLMINGDGRIYIRINLSRLETNSADGFKSFLAKENIKIQCELATPIIKTVDLSSSGNWEKVVLDGSESNIVRGNDGANHVNTIEFYVNNVLVDNAKLKTDFSDTLPYRYANTDEEHFYSDGKRLVVFVSKSKLQTQDVEGFRQWLSQNPITVWYQTSTTADSTQVKQPIFFKDGHIIQSSGADNSLISTLDYQAKTSNSYVMDLMKTNTKYTMKAKTASGTFTIDGTSYGAGTNGTFTTPSSMTNKFLVMSNKTNEEVMILEGDLTSKDIPYFKGIKSAFEDESKIEVLSTGKNIYYNDSKLGNGETYRSNGLIFTKVGTNIITITGTKTSDGNSDFRLYKAEDKYPIKKGTYTVSCQGSTNENVRVIIRPANGAYREMRLTETYTFTATNDDVFSYIIIRDSNPSGTVLNETIHLQIEECSQPTTYEPYKSNSTKIQLLSPLRSLPNGVCDELIVDRMKNKATLIQRIKSTVFNGSEGWSLNGYSHDKLVEFVCHGSVQMAHTIFSDRFITGGDNVERVAFSGGSIYVRISKTKVSNVDSFKKWLSQNPLTIQCGLQTPVITEVDLEGFPYIYKDGHIFLNSEIAPTIEIIYSINQCQQISASNEDIIRHEKELTYLQKLIAQYVQVDYESALLSLKV